MAISEHISMKSIFSHIGALLLLVGCAASTTPQYSERWVHASLSENDKEFAFDRCELAASAAHSRYLEANPEKSLYEPGGGLNNFGRQIGALRESGTARSACMRAAGFSLENVCVENCELARQVNTFVNELEQAEQDFLIACEQILAAIPMLTSCDMSKIAFSHVALNRKISTVEKVSMMDLLSLRNRYWDFRLGIIESHASPELMSSLSKEPEALKRHSLFRKERDALNLLSLIQGDISWGEYNKSQKDIWEQANKILENTY
jgi:hypothetical protein